MALEFSLAHPQRLLFGRGVFERLGREVAALLPSAGPRRVLLVTGRSAMRRAGHLERAHSLLREAGLEAVVFDRIEHDPSLVTVQEGIETCIGEGCAAVVGLGGGSALDAAKAIAIMATQEASLVECFDQRRAITRRGLPLLAVPTTAGTGAEATRNAVLTDRSRRLKMSLRHDFMVPDVALCDPLLTLSAPPDLTAHSGMDALTQAIECAISRAAQPVSDALCFHAAKILHDTLPAVVADGSDVALRERMLLGSTMTGLAFANTSLGAVHGLSHPIGAELHLPHGFICGVLLPDVLEMNLQAPYRDEAGRTTRDKTAELAAHLGYRSPEALVDGLRDLRACVGLPDDLSDCGITDHLVQAIVRKCRSGSMASNPRILSDEEIAEFVRRIAGITSASAQRRHAAVPQQSA